ncbi:hypothetical protein, partial [Streptomyces venezuelae]
MAHTWITSAAVFLPAALPREGRVAFWAPDGRPLPDPGDSGAERVELTVARRHGSGARGRSV